MEGIAAASLSSDKAIAQEAIWQAAKMYDQTGQTDDAIRMYKKYVWEFKEPYTDRVEAQYRLVKLYEQKKDFTKRDFWLGKIVEWYFERGDNNNQRTQLLAAQAALQLAEPKFEAFKRIKLKQPLKRSLKRKKRAMQQATAAYTRIAKIGLQEYTNASTYRIGEIYRLFADDIMNSERPRGLDELALEEYEILLEDQALPFEDKAIAILQKNANKTKDGIWDQWIEKSFNALSRLLPARYDKKELTEDVIDEIY